MHFSKVLAVLSFAAVAIAAPHPNSPTPPTSNTKNAQTGGNSCFIGDSKDEGQYHCCDSTQALKPTTQNGGSSGSGLLGGLGLLDNLLGGGAGVQAGLGCTQIPIVNVVGGLMGVSCQKNGPKCCSTPQTFSNNPALISALNNVNLNALGCSDVSIPL